jgi:hypothetical protein
MKAFSIVNLTSGHYLGIFQGESELIAYRAMLTDAGYDENSEDSVSQWSGIPDDMRVKEVDLYSREHLEAQWQIDLDALPPEEHLPFDEYLRSFYVEVGGKYASAAPE